MRGSDTDCETLISAAAPAPVQASHLNWSHRSAIVVLIVLSLAACDLRPSVAPAPRSAAVIESPTLTPSSETVSCLGLKVPFDREVNTNLDRENGLLEFSYVRRLQRDKSATIRYRDDLSCRRNPDTRRLIEHVGAGREIVGCLDLPEVPPEGMTRVELWFGDNTDQSAVAPSLLVHRDIPATDAIAAATVEAWIEGPNDEEKEAGAYPSAPEGSQLLGIDIDDGTAVVDLNERFERTGLGTIYEGAVLEQLAGTITQFGSVDRGLLKIDGRFKDYYLGHGFIVDEEHPLLRPDAKRYRVAREC